MQNLVLSPIAPEMLISMIANKVTDNVLAAMREENQKRKQYLRPGYITRKDVAKMLHVTLPTVHAWINKGKIRAYHVGGRTLFKESEILETVKPAN